jgi:Rad3-related DNA helicase
LSSLHLALDSILVKYKAVEQRGYQVACIGELTNAINEGNDALLHLPTGTGKTFIYAPIAIEASESGYRTCVLCYTKYMQEKVRGDFARFPGGNVAKTIFGVSLYHCPRFRRKADNWTCKENREDCINQAFECEVLASEKRYSEAPLIVTNYSKFLKYMGADWDLIIIDDSHSFETVKEQAYQYSVNYGLVDETYEKNQSEETIGNFLGSFCDIFDDIFQRAFPKERKQGTLGSDYVKRIAEEIFSDDDEKKLRAEIQKLPDRDKQLCEEVYRFVVASKRAADHSFYLRKDWFTPEDPRLAELIAREVKATVDFKIPDRFRKARVILATATPGDPQKHMSECTHRNYTKGGLQVVPETMPEPLVDWFRNLDIYLISDLGDTRSLDNFTRALRFATDIINATKVKTILLFKNYNDQKMAKDFMENEFKDIYFVERDDDEDTIHEYANQSRIILASASTRLWEGISIQDLCLGIIFTPPFIRVPVHIPPPTYPYNERIMLRRLQQGIGRLIRNETDEGTCLLLDVNFEKYIRKKRFDKELRNRIHKADSTNLATEIGDRFKE